MSDFETPLPELPNHLCNTPTIPDAYAKILSFERALCNLNRTDDHVKRLMYARIVGYLILEGPSEQACIAVAHEVVSCKNEEELLTIGQYYYYHYICAFRQYRGHSPTPSSSWPASASESISTPPCEEDIPQDYKQVKHNALVRDGFHCVVTGCYDLPSCKYNSELNQAVKARKTGAIFTHGQQILPESIFANISRGNMQDDIHRYATGTVLDRFGYKRILDDLNGPNIHHLENVFTVCNDVQFVYSALELWFEPTDVPNTYRPHMGDCFYIDPAWKTTVTFTTPDPINLPVPSQDYFELHAGCCRVAHLSGAGHHINSMLEEMEGIEILSPDGTSAEVLQHTLQLLCQLNSDV